MKKKDKVFIQIFQCIAILLQYNAFALFSCNTDAFLLVLHKTCSFLVLRN